MAASSAIVTLGITRLDPTAVHHDHTHSVHQAANGSTGFSSSFVR